MRSFAAIMLLLCVTAAAAGQAAAQKKAGLVFCTCEGGFWQIWLSEIRGENPRRLTTSAFDKRCPRFVREGHQLLFRDNQGELYMTTLDPGATPKPVLANIEVVKDYDFDSAYGFLVSSYAPNAQDNIRIWWCSAEGKEKRLIVPDVYLNEMPRWLPGGRSFLYVKSHLGKSQILRYSFESPRSEPLFTSPSGSTSEPAPSPDGKWVAYCQEGPKGMDLWLTDTNGQNSRVLYAGPGLEADPAWDTVGAQIFFSTWKDQHFRIARINTDGTDLRFLTPDTIDCRYPVVVEYQAPTQQ